MSWENIKATGRGKLEFRLAVEGWPYQFVSHLGMEQTTGDGRIRVAGLDRQGLVLEEMAKPHLAELDGRAITARIVDREEDDAATAAFFTLPTVTTWLDTNVTTSGTTLSTLSTAGLPAGDVVHVGTEAILIGAVGADLTGCTRAYWDTIAQAHYTSDAVDGLGEARVTDQPLGLEGRRAFLYVYGEGDPLTGDGTLVWRGICSTDAGLASDGCSWEISIDPITRVLDQEMGADLEPVQGVRGIYYPRTAPLAIHVEESADATNSPTALSGGFAYVYGFYERQEDLVAEVQSQLNTLTASLSGDYFAVADGDDNWWIECETASASPKFPFMGFISPVDGVNGYIGFTAGSISIPGDTAPSSSVTTSTRYKTQTLSDFVPGSRTVPRGFLGARRPGDRSTIMDDRDFEGHTPPANGTPTEPNYIWPHGRFSLAGLSGATCEITREDATFVTTFFSPDDAARSVRLNGINVGRSTLSDAPVQGPYTRDAPLEFTTTITLEGNGSIADVRDYLTTNSPTETNRARLPFVTDSDLADWSTVVQSVADDSRLLAHRTFHVVDSVSLAEYFREEWRLLGVYPALDSDGKVTIRALDTPLATDPGAVSVTASEHLVDDGFAQWERNAWGTLNAVSISLGYDPKLDTYGMAVAVRDKGTYPNRKAPKKLVIEPKSRMVYLSGRVDEAREMMRLGAIDIGSRALGMFGRDYAIISGGVPLTLFDTLVGDKVLLTMDHIPDGEGGRGITNEPAIVVGRRWDLDQGRGEMQFLVQYQNLGGYTPAVQITAETDTSPPANEWDITVSTTDPSGTWQTFADGTNIGNHFAAGDRVQARQWNTSTPTTQTGEVVSVTDSTAASGATPATGTMVIQFDGAVTLGTGTWVLGFSQADDPVVAGQELYVYFSDTASEVAFSTTAPAFEFTG